MCGKDDLGSTFGEIAQVVYEAYERFYEPDRPFPPDAEPEGRHPVDIVREMLGGDAPDGLAEALVGYLNDLERAGELGDKPYLFEHGDRYKWSGIWQNTDYERRIWHEFREYLLHHRRFFAPNVAEYLENVVEQLKLALEGVDLTLPEGVRIYRARLVKSHTEAERVEADPARELGPPPRPFRRGGRLDAPGMAVFYGGFSPETCIAELRPPVGTHAALAEFETIRPLTILDLTETEFSHINLLRERAESQIGAIAFLQAFHKIITEPTMPEDTAVGYIPTQVVAEYLNEHGGFDGILYRSVQFASGHDGDKEGLNLAIFNAEGIVEGVPAASRADDDPLSGNFEIPELLPRLRHVEGSFRLVRIRGAQYNWTPAYNMEDYILDVDDVGVTG